MADIGKGLSLTFDPDASPIALATKFDVGTARFASMLVKKMTWLMTELQKKAQVGVPSSRVKESIRNPRAEVEGNKVTAYLDWGGVEVQYEGGRKYDLALIFEQGTKGYAINPLTNRLTGKPTPREHKKGGLPERGGTGSRVLHWAGGYGRDGEGTTKEVGTFRWYAFRKPRPGLHFMRSAVNKMDWEAEIKKTIQEFLGTIRKSPF